MQGRCRPQVCCPERSNGRRARDLSREAEGSLTQGRGSGSAENLGLEWVATPGLAVERCQSYAYGGAGLARISDPDVVGEGDSEERSLKLEAVRAK
jgi:hypothetical protein